MRRIPVPLIRANQLTLVAAVVVAFGLQAPWLLLALAFVLLAGVVGGPDYNLVFRIARPLLRDRLVGALTDDAGAQRFNQTLATLMLFTSAALHYGFGWTAAAWVVAFALGGVALVAALGFCLGCVIYYRLPGLRALFVRAQRG